VFANLKYAPRKYAPSARALGGVFYTDVKPKNDQK
jgi:hypothetical protein